ncbi:LysR family transcriptional regulator [Cryobacterium sp. TMT1-66-1]|uniref:LysR family transcriptional regulator n=1 Tax=unclassified Cryobacterium TaxID=2649013 RepID=UPI00272D9C31|nr:LysR family transcriptional regulator [Cryobacterium sp. TMT1-66-1]
MLFRQLEYFVAVARERHFAHAAAACHVSQPALSAGISKLEQELNVSLINRGHAFEGLTPEGELVVMWAKRIVAERDTLKAEVHALKSGVTGVLRLGVVPSASTTVALPVAAFCAAHPLGATPAKPASQKEATWPRFFSSSTQIPSPGTRRSAHATASLYLITTQNGSSRALTS